MNQHAVFRSESVARWVDTDLIERETDGTREPMLSRPERPAPHAAQSTQLRYRPFEQLARFEPRSKAPVA